MKYLYVTTVSNTVNAFLIPHIKMLIDQGHSVDVACCIEQPIKDELLELGCQIYEVPFSRSVLKNKFNVIQKRLKEILDNNDYDVIHTHTPIASALIRYAARTYKNIKVIYTAHGFHFFKGGPLLNWLFFYPVEKYLSKYTDKIITINQEDYYRAKQFGQNNIEFIPGVGYNVQQIEEDIYQIEDYYSEFDIQPNQVVMLSVGELNDNKNHETVLKALSESNINEYKYIICGDGHKKEILLNLIEELKLTGRVHLAGYRSDIPKIMNISDIFIFPSYREGLSVALMEAMATGLPVVCSNIRGNRDLIDNNFGGINVQPNDVAGFKDAIEELYQNKEKRQNFGEYNLEKVKKFSLEVVLQRLSEVYKKVEL